MRTQFPVLAARRSDPLARPHENGQRSPGSINAGVKIAAFFIMTMEVKVGGSGRDDVDNGGDGSPEVETGKIVETAGEALAKAGFKPSKKGRRILGQGRPRETLKKRPYQTDKTGEKNDDRDAADEAPRDETKD